jgi:hypothetical protein
MPFDMDVPVQPAYGTVNTANMGLQMGLSEMISSGMASGTGSADTKIKIRDVDADRIPCPRLCGASFGTGSGVLVTFHNGEVKKMWDWYQKTDMVRLSSIPGGGVEATARSDPEMIMSKSSTETDKKIHVPTSSGPRSLKELSDMMTKAKEVS